MTDINDWGDVDSQPDRDEPDDQRDYWQEHKDGVAMGYINPDGSQREPDEPDWGALDDADGPAATSPEDPWGLPEGETYDTESPF